MRHIYSLVNAFSQVNCVKTGASLLDVNVNLVNIHWLNPYFARYLYEYYRKRKVWLLPHEVIIIYHKQWSVFQTSNITQSNTFYKILVLYSKLTTEMFKLLCNSELPVIPWEKQMPGLFLLSFWLHASGAFLGIYTFNKPPK